VRTNSKGSYFKITNVEQTTGNIIVSKAINEYEELSTLI
jgi:hypothetical protein